MSKRVFIAGHRGLVGSALHRHYQKLPDWEPIVRSRSELDLKDAGKVAEFLQAEKPDAVILAAAKVGGIKANNDFPVDFLLQNLQIQNSVIQGAFEAGVTKLLFLGSSCIYPKFAPQPMREDCLLTGILEPTNEAYAIAKIAGLKLCQAYQKQYGARFICAMPTNMYGPFDNFDLETSHVLPAMIRKFHEAKVGNNTSMTLWGTGTPRREFLHSDDLADACALLVDQYESPEIVNIGVGEDLSIRELAEMIRDIVGYTGEIVWDSSKPDGTPRKLMDVSRIDAFGWKARIPLKEGIAGAYQWFLKNA